jgi:DNA-binding beta-propeller fold protein YncE
LYVPSAEQIGNLFLLDPATNTFLPNPAALGAVPTYITVSPELNRAYVSNFFGGLSVIDTTSGGVITEVMGLASPIGTAVDAQLTKLYVINNLINTVSAIDTNTNQITNSVAFSCTEQDVKIDTLLHKAFVANGSCSELAVWMSPRMR